MINFVNIEGYKGSCDIFNPVSIDAPEEKSYCPQTYFATNNLFSEILTESLRETARINLDFSWKNLLGDITLAPNLSEYILLHISWENILGSPEDNESLTIAIDKRISNFSSYWVNLD